MARSIGARHLLLMALGQAFLAQTASAIGYAAAAVIDDLPSCATSCFTSALEIMSCSLDNYTLMSDCLCTNLVVQSSFSACVQQQCVVSDVPAAISVENQICEGYPRESRAPETILTAVITLVISIPVVIARCTARIKYSNRLWSDDYMSILATFFLAVLATIQIVYVKYGFGHHQWEPEILENNALLLLLLYVSQIAYTIVQCLARLSILLLYRRIFGVSTRWFKWTVNAMLVLTGIVGVAYTFLLIFQCWPVAAAWDLTIPNFKCYSFAPLLFSASLLSIVADLFLMGIPIPELRKLQISGRKRLAVGIMFIVASLGVVASIVRLQFLVKLNWSYDLSWDEIDVVIWSLIELLFIIVCGSLPALRPYFRSLMPRLTATWRRSTQSLKRPRSLSTTRQSAETGDIPRDSKDDMICDHLQLHPLSSVRGGEEWTKIPDEPCIPTRAVPRPSSQAFVDRAVAYLPNNIKVTRSYTVKEFHDDRF